MLRLHKSVAFTAIVVAALSSVSVAKKADQGTNQRVPTSEWSDQAAHFAIDPNSGEPYRMGSSSVANTLFLATYKFDNGPYCLNQSWTSVDITAPTGNYWHVDDFALTNSLGSITGGTSQGGLSFTPIQGAKSLWLGKRIPPAGPVDPVHCGYVGLPGYGNGWNQSFCSKACLATSGGPTSNLDVAFRLKFDTEPSYDATSLEYTTDCTGNLAWTEIDGGNPEWTGARSFTVSGAYPVGSGPVKIRLHFTSDTSWSNQDGFYMGFGVAVDSLTWEGTAIEDFEDEAVGANSSNDWQSCNSPGFGNYLALFRHDAANYEDQCLDNFSCYWAALQGSTEFYTCGVPSQPTQRIVPHMNVRGEYISNEIWSPLIPLTGSGNDFHLRYTVYRDLPLDNLIFHVWHVRTIGASGCPGPWMDRNFVFYGDTKDWFVFDNAIGSKIDLNTGTSIQVALGVLDMCPFWCGIFGTGACHSAAPYFDKVQVLRVDITGPQWDIRTIDTFQDTFSANGTITGTARADEAIDIKPWGSPTVTPGDSAIVLFLTDAKYVSGVGTNSSGLSDDPNISTFIGRHKTKKQVYMYVSVWPQGQAARTGAALSEGPGGQANRYPYSGTVSANGVTWTKIRMDYTYTGTASNPGNGHPTPNAPSYIANRFNVDLNDNLFTPGDTICYFYGATSPGGTTYYSTEYGTADDINVIAANPMEFTILPAGGFNRGGNMLYVDGADGTINNVYFDGAFLSLGLSNRIDRFDVRGPSSSVGNRLGGRVVNVAAQLNACYREIIWDCGSFSATLGDGSGDPEKTDDYALLNSFLGNLTNPGGVYLSGDRVAAYLNGYAGASAVNFRSNYMPFSLINDNHRLPPTNFRISPDIKPWPGRAYVDDFFVFGGCPELNDFAVIGAVGTSQVQMSYNTASSPQGAVLSHTNGNATVIMSGFSFAQIRDNDLDGVPDRASFLYRTNSRIGLIIIVDGVTPAKSDYLSQNYPNPFNPQTTIAFSTTRRDHVTLSIYDVNGALVRELVNETRAAGAYELTWDGHDANGQQVASGVYFYRLVAGDFTKTRKMVLLK